MKKTFRGIGLLFAGFAAFLFVLWMTFPWEEAVRYALLHLGRQAGEQGMRLSVEGLRADGGVSPRFTVEKLVIASPMGTITQRNVQAQLDPFASILFPGARFDVRWGRGFFDAFGKTISWDRGETALGARPGRLAMNNLSCVGQLQAEGNLAVNLDTRKFENTDVRIGLPAGLSDVMGGAALFLPLKQEGEGVWRLKWGEGDA